MLQVSGEQDGLFRLDIRLQRDPSEAFAKLHFSSHHEKHSSGEIEARITQK